MTKKIVQYDVSIDVVNHILALPLSSDINVSDSFIWCGESNGCFSFCTTNAISRSVDRSFSNELYHLIRHWLELQTLVVLFRKVVRNCLLINDNCVHR